jgi:Flp pilus assembly pilin Flp
MMRNLWKDEAGFIVSAELVLVATIVVIGMIVGLTLVRNQVVQELADVAMAIGSISQSFCFAGISAVKPGGSIAWTDGSCYIDLVDFCQSPQTPGNPPAGIQIGLVPSTPYGGERPW